MIKNTFFVLFVIFFCYSTPDYSKSINSKIKIKIKTTEYTKLSASIYHAEANQTDSSYLETASLDIIDTHLLKTNKLRWCAISKDLHKKSGGKYKFGDTIEIKSHYSILNGKWVIKDRMNKRFKNKIDFLVHRNSKFKGFYKNKDYIIIVEKKNIYI